MMLIPVFFIENEFNLSVLSGIFVVPFLGFILPILLDYIYFYGKRSSLQSNMKLLLLFVAIGINGYSAVKQFL